MSDGILRDGVGLDELAQAINAMLSKLPYDLRRRLKIPQGESEESLMRDGAALRCLMGSGYKIVCDDDGTLWPFVPGVGYWRGPLRKREGRVEEARFYPDLEQIRWVPPWSDDDACP